MSKLRKVFSFSWTALVRHAVRFKVDRRGNVAMIMGLSMVPIVGALGLGFEVSNWYMRTHAMQNAADAATIAAATNASSNYDVEAKAVAGQYGFVDGSNNVTVAASNTAACPSGGNTCYSVTISSYVPLYLSQVLGYSGNAALNGTREEFLSATAVGILVPTPTQYCILALASSGQQGIRSNGAPNANMTGCNVMSDTTSTCNGANLQASIGAAHGTNNGCGNKQYSNVPTVSDPYSGLASNIPANPCGSSYPQEPAKKNDPALPSTNQWSGTQNLSGNVIMCGDLKLTSNVTIDAPSNAVLVIENGQLDTNGFTLTTSSGSGLTVVFSGTNSGSYTHAPTGGGTLDISSPATGPWKGIALYQDPSLTSGIDISAAGNTPTWDISGLVYLPHSSVTFSGAVNKASNGQSCFAMVVDNLLINGTGSILETGGCAAQGLDMPTGNLPGRGQLVL
jgi:Flp pilus assembly protein TadG